MRPVFEVARRCPRKVVYAEGEDDRVLRAVQTVVDEKLALPVLIGRREVIYARTEKLGLRLDFRNQVEIMDPMADVEAFKPLIARYQQIVERRGVPPDAAKRW